MGFLQNLFSGGAGSLVDSVGKVLDNVVTTKEEKMQLENEIRKSEMQFQIDIKKLSNEEQQMILGDISSARQRDIQVQNANTTKLNKNLMPILAFGTIVLVFSLFYILIFSPALIHDGGKEIAMYLLGILSAVLTQIYSYYFGSSAGSADKSKTLANMQQQKS